ncbi:MAG TPA: DUF1772 domain-containing protein [Actinophytocola sp.]|jgi:uncharacterized membrane protein|uniref:anthrone oxygenase family protein n=1 Tax=Actinophytocola sp. TaxID=1872138 RepID=UPI002F95BF03
MQILQVAVLVLATMTTALVTGLFYGFAMSVLVAMRDVDDRTYVEVNQKINRAILNGRFMVIFLGSVLLSALAAVLLLAGDRGAALAPAGLAFALNLVAFLVTGGGNVPLNKQLDAAGRPDTMAHPTRVRTRYEAPWTRLNSIRTALHFAAFGCLCWALVAFGF